MKKKRGTYGHSASWGGLRAEEATWARAGEWLLYSTVRINLERQFRDHVGVWWGNGVAEEMFDASPLLFADPGSRLFTHADRRDGGSQGIVSLILAGDEA
jgi:hypothetical protein